MKEKLPFRQAHLGLHTPEKIGETGVKAPVYIRCGLDEKMARRHPEWLMRDIDNRTEVLS